jgi:hypothetical protein
VILLADAYDITRNAEYYYRSDPNSKLDQVLGLDSPWRDRLSNLSNYTGDNVRNLFADIYKEQLKRHLGYTFFGHKTIESLRGPLYKLIYASKDELGLKFWNIAMAKDFRGQRDLFEIFYSLPYVAQV